MGRKLARSIQFGLLFAAILFGYTLFFDSEFSAWKAEFRQYALQQGITEATLDVALHSLLPDNKVLKLDAHQPEFSRPVWEYLDTAVSAARVEQGRAKLLEYADLLDQIEARYGVQKKYIVAIWGMESNFGQQTGSYSVIRSLATLAYKGRVERRDFWREQLMAALRILQQGDISMVALQGSWAGAIGHTQFIPTTFEQYAVDFDGDGQRDLVNSIPDALASSAHYLAESGWQPGQSWGEEVRLPSRFEWTQADPSNWQALDYWAGHMGVVRADGSSLIEPGVSSAALAERAFILLPAGHLGPAFAAFPNYQVILKYNNALSYALAVGYLGDRMGGAGELLAAWPREEPTLSRVEKAELQELLSAVGYSTDGIDGNIGPNTRAALRRWQADVGFPSDGYATLAHLRLLRGQAELRTTSQSDEDARASRI